MPAGSINALTKTLKILPGKKLFSSGTKIGNYIKKRIRGQRPLKKDLDQ